MNDPFNALVVRANPDSEAKPKTLAAIESLSLADLPSESVLIKVDFSSLNYKDGLVVSGKGRVCRSLPMVGGIDLAGTVVESDDGRFASGDKVLVNGYGLSEDHWGGYSQYQRVNADFLITQPSVFSSAQTMAIGTAGYTAMLCVMAIQDHGIKPAEGPVLVTGAAGGVGSMAVMLLAKLGFEVIASTGRLSSESGFLRSLGATEVIDREQFNSEAKPLSKEQWAAVVDSVGGQPLATILSQVKYEGLVAACGLAAGMSLPSTVAPFILRGVTLRGIDSVMASADRRQRAWALLAETVDLQLLDTLSVIKPMSDLPQLANDILKGQVKGRVVVDVNG